MPYQKEMRHLHIELTPAQYQLLTEKAKQCGLTKRALVVRLLEGRGIRARPSQEIKELRWEVHKIGVNVHYLYVLGKVEQRRYPPRMTPQLRQEVMRFERFREQFAFLRDNDLATPADMAAFQTRTEETMAALTKQRTILNVQKKKRQHLYTALADVEALAPARQLYEDGLSGMEPEFARYMEAVAVLEECGIPREQLTAEKADIYQKLAEVNRQIRAERKKLALCREIHSHLPRMEQEIQTIEQKDEVIHNEHRRR